LSIPIVLTCLPLSFTMRFYLRKLLEWTYTLYLLLCNHYKVKHCWWITTLISFSSQNSLLFYCYHFMLHSWYWSSYILFLLLLSWGAIDTDYHKASKLFKVNKHTIYVFIFVGVNFRGFCGHVVICEITFFVNSQIFLLDESMKISAVQLQPFLHNDPFLLKCCLIAYCVMMALLNIYYFLSFITETAKGSKIFFFLHN